MAQIGLLTGALETFAAAVGTGMVTGGFLVGFYGLLAGWRRQEVREEALDAGYAGGAAGVLAVLVDLLVRYIV